MWECGTWLAQPFLFLNAGFLKEHIVADKKAPPNRWSHKVQTVSTFPPAGLFTRNAATVAKVMASKKVSPKGIASGIRMIQFFINRAGKNLPAARKKELEKAKSILQARIRQKK
jgi:hypothetical protein